MHLPQGVAVHHAGLEVDDRAVTKATHAKGTKRLATDCATALHEALHAAKALAQGTQ